MATPREIVKKVKNGILYSDGSIRIDNVRASYPHLDKMYQAPPGKDGKQSAPAFSIVGMLDKKTHVDAKNLIVEVMNGIQKEKDTKVAKDKKFIRDGDDGDKLEYEGYWTVSARETRRPSVRHRSGEPMSEKEIQDIIYAGCRVNILVNPWFQDNDFGKRINSNLLAVQFVRDDEQIGQARIDDEGVFDPIEGEDDDGMGGSLSDDDDL